MPTRTLDPALLDRSALRTIADLRRTDHRRFAETLVHRAECLDSRDAALITLIYRDGLRAIDVARLLGPPHSAATVRRRLRALIVRMLSPRFEHVLRARKRWPIERRRIATALVLQGHTQKATAERLGLTLHDVRKELAVIDALTDEAIAKANRSGAA